MAKNSAKRLATAQRKKWQKLLQSNGVNTVNGNEVYLSVLIDTNIWYSAILYGGQPEELIRFCVNNCQIVISPFIINEIRTKLKIDGKAPYKWLNALEKQLKRLCLDVDVDIIPIQTRDPKDDPVIASAILGNCHYLVTGDNDLLILRSIGRMKIVTLNQFLDLI